MLDQGKNQSQIAPLKQINSALKKYKMKVLMLKEILQYNKSKKKIC